MLGKKNNSGFAAQAAAPAHDHSRLEQVLAGNAAPEQLCAELAKIFRVRKTEIALLRLERSLLKFVVPPELGAVGAIPVSSSAVAAHTATTKKAELFNTFNKIKHASIFEMIRLGTQEETDPSEQAPIQKLMTSPIMDATEKVLGVVQISRKGFDLAGAGADFTLDDLQRLEKIAQVLAKAEFMSASR
jgi:hypothetical protein